MSSPQTLWLRPDDLGPHMLELSASEYGNRCRKEPHYRCNKFHQCSPPTDVQRVLHCKAPLLCQTPKMQIVYDNSQSPIVGCLAKKACIEFHQGPDHIIEQLDFNIEGRQCGKKVTFYLIFWWPDGEISVVLN